MNEISLVSITIDHYEKLVAANTELAALKALLQAREAEYAGLSYKEIETLAKMYCKPTLSQEVAGE